MIRLTDDKRKVPGIALGSIWVGNSGDESCSSYYTHHDIGAILNVAQDMQTIHNWMNGIEMMHVGLVDGPGNEPCAYIAAVLALHALLKRHNTLVCCHSGRRSLAVVIMYLSAASGCSWNMLHRMLCEKTEQDLPEPRAEHKESCNTIDWRTIEKLLR